MFNQWEKLSILTFTNGFDQRCYILVIQFDRTLVVSSTCYNWIDFLLYWVTRTIFGHILFRIERYEREREREIFAVYLYWILILFFYKYSCSTLGYNAIILVNTYNKKIGWVYWFCVVSVHLRKCWCVNSIYMYLVCKYWFV